MTYGRMWRCPILLLLNRHHPTTRPRSFDNNSLFRSLLLYWLPSLYTFFTQLISEYPARIEARCSDAGSFWFDRGGWSSIVRVELPYSAHILCVRFCGLVFECKLSSPRGPPSFLREREGCDATQIQWLRVVRMQRMKGETTDPSPRAIVYKCSPRRI